MEHHALNARMAQLLAAAMLATSATSVFLFPDMEKRVLWSANLAFCGLLLRTGRTLADAGTRRWEQVAIATWLAASPRLLGFEHVVRNLWMTIACAVLLFVPAAWMACLEETPRRIEVRSRRSQWRRPF